MQSAAFRLRLSLGFCFCLSFYFGFCGFRRSLGNLDPCDAGVGGCVCACALAVASIAGLLGLFTGRVGGIVGGYRRSILIVDRLYYRIIRLGLFCLTLSLCFLAFLFLSFLLLYIYRTKDICQHPIPLHDIRRRTSFSCSRSFASRSFLSFSRNSRSVITQAAAPSAAASGRDLFFRRSAERTYCQRPSQSRHAPHRTRNPSR
jgi:hypothetical protein